MIALKKFYGDELLRLALVLSLLKVDPNEYLEVETQELISGLPISNGSDWSQEQEARTLIRPRFIHPKSLDNILINYERRLFEELNSLGRYVDNNGRTWNNRGPIVHTYLLDNVATNTTSPVLDSVDIETPSQDGVSSDDNVAHEIKITDEETQQYKDTNDSDETGAVGETHTQPDAIVTLSADFFNNHSESDIFAAVATKSFETTEESNQNEEFKPTVTKPDAFVTLPADFFTDHSESDVFAEVTVKSFDLNSEESKNEDDDATVAQPDVTVTLSADFFNNRSESDIFAEIATRSFDVNDFLVNPNEMQLKKEPETSELLDVRIKKEREDDGLYNDNAIDDFIPYFASKSDSLQVNSNSIYNQNIADLHDYEEMFEMKDIKHDLDLDMKHQSSFEQYLIENTPLDAEVYELAPMFEDELVLDVKRDRASTSSFTASSSGVSEMDVSVRDYPDVKLEPDEGHHTGDELTQEDMDLIEVLWKQDVDMGFSLDDPIQPEGPQATKVLGDEIDKELKRAEQNIIQKKNEEQAEKDKVEIEKVKVSLLNPEIKEDDPWAGLSYTVDTETGEYVIQGDIPSELVNSEDTRFDLLEEALQLVELGDEAETKNEPAEPAVKDGSSSSGSGAMLHPAMRQLPHHPLAHYHNQSLMRSMSVEQRWQDLASMLTIPPPPEQYQHYHHHHHHHQHPHNISGHGAAAGYAPNYHAPHAPIPPVTDKHPDPYAGAAAPIEGAYKVESAHHPQQHDGLYYQNSTSEMPPPGNQDGFLQSILNDEDLQLMDMAMNEGMYTMRMLDSAGAHHAPHHNHSHMMIAERDSASDSAVSSMGSERVPSLSDGEWCDGSDSAQEFHSSKFRPYDSAYGRERSAPHQPQKKHHMFGKRSFQEQPTPTLEPVPAVTVPAPVKYECPEQTYHHDTMHMHNEFSSRHQLAGPLVPSLQPALDLNTAHSSHALLQSIPSPAQSSPVRFTYGTPERVRHNHTYSAPLAAAELRPQAVRDKRVRRLTDGSISDGGSSATSLSQHLSRDEKRAKALGIPMEVQDIINLPMDEFNERLSKHDLSEAQLSLIRDIRRRGKNKVAAQNCRKRKLDQITSLADEVRTVRDRKVRTQRDHNSLVAERQRLKETFAALYRHVFQNLRDPDGRPLSSNQYSLQQAADGNVVLVPKMPQHPDHPMNRTSDDDNDRKPKHYDQ